VKILLVAPYFRDSFAGKISMGSAVMAAEQLSRQHQVLVITSGRDNPREVVSDRLTILSATGFLLPDPINYVITPACLGLVIRQVRRFEPDLVLVNKFMFFTSFAAPIAKWMGKRTILITDTYPGLNWFPRNRLVAATMWLYARLIGIPLLRMVDKVVVLHEGLIDIAEKYKLNYQVIHNGKDLSDADAAEPAPDLPKPSNEIWISYVGRLESVKGYDYLLRAVAPLHDRYPHLRTFFIGASDPMNHRTAAGVTFLGFRNDVYSVLKRMDIFCLPSLSEGLPNSLMEAMSVSCASIASNVGGVPYLIEDGVNGLLVPPRDPTALTNAIERLIQNPDLKKKLGDNARRTIETRFNWSTLLDEYERLFATLLPHER
jgi:glycosyltransferase involved in cell wall biosynthesis